LNQKKQKKAFLGKSSKLAFESCKIVAYLESEFIERLHKRIRFSSLAFRTKQANFRFAITQKGSVKDVRLLLDISAQADACAMVFHFVSLISLPLPIEITTKNP
jgi:hypothetical protein